VRAHLAGEDDELVRVAPALEGYDTFDSFLGTPEDYGDAWRAQRKSDERATAWKRRLDCRARNQGRPYSRSVEAWAEA